MIRSLLPPHHPLPHIHMKTNVPQKTKYPEFVAYHFLNVRGELMAMEEDGASTEMILTTGGFSVDGSSIAGMSFVEKSDLKVVPEPESFLTLHIGNFVHHRILSHLELPNGQPHPRDPRNVLKKQVDRAHKLGFEPYMFSEIEFYVVDKDSGLPVDQAGYCSLPPNDTSYDFRHNLGQICKAAGMEVKRIHHECGPGQNEIELNLTPCLKNADDTVLCKWILDVLAAQQNQEVLFSPKPFITQAGNGLHHHIMFKKLGTEENVFLNPKAQDKDQESRLSDTCKHGIAGLLKYAAEITAVFASSKESFTRLQPGFEAPSQTAWDFSNRTALVRVPQTSKMTRFEYRGGDFSGSVHIFGAILLAAVLKGIEDELPLQPNSNFNVELLSPVEMEEHGIRSVPNTAAECLEVLKTSEFLKESLGSEMVEVLIERTEKLQ